MIKARKIIGTRLATTGLTRASVVIDAGVVIGVVFGVLSLGLAIYRLLSGQLFFYVILGFAFTVTTVLLGLIITFFYSFTYDSFYYIIVVNKDIIDLIVMWDICIYTRFNIILYFKLKVQLLACSHISIVTIYLVNKQK